MPITSIQFLWCVAAYFIGAIPFGVIVSRFIAKKDVRSHGSGNIGATNVSRMMGKKWGITVLILDALKGFLITFLALKFETLEFANVIALIAVVGHCYPIYLKFKGGKGVATALGAIIALSSLALVICLGAFVLIILATRMVSAASLGAALVLPFASVILHLPLQPVTATVLTLIVWWKHRENIQRLIKKTEPKFF